MWGSQGCGEASWGVKGGDKVLTCHRTCLFVQAECPFVPNKPWDSHVGNYRGFCLGKLYSRYRKSANE
eukprot:4017228-Pyramimonas_sp.AAC.1